MQARTQGERLIADVKCYFCGHVSGQIIGRRGEALRPSNFVPRPGFGGQLPSQGARLRCERCNGPVFLEDALAAGTEPNVESLLKTSRSQAGRAKAA